MLILGIVIVVVVVIFAAGFASTGSSGTSNQGNDHVEGCAAACRNLIAKRAQVCSHRADVASATANRNAAAAKVGAATFAAIAAAAVAAAAVLIPFIGPLIAPAMIAASVTAWGYLDFVTGQLAGASAALGVQIDGLNDAMRFETDATNIVLRDCPPDEAQRCIGSLQTCPI